MLYLILRKRAKKIIKKNTEELNKCPSYFWLTTSEKEKFKKACVLVYSIKQKYKELEDEYDEAGYVRNNDGSISTRSNLGKNYWEYVNKTSGTLSIEQRNIAYLANKPKNDWKINKNLYDELLNAYRAKKASLFAFFIFLFLFILFYILIICFYNNQLFESISILFAAGIYILPPIFYKLIKKKTKIPYEHIPHIPNEPPLVTTSNIDVY